MPKRKPANTTPDPLSDDLSSGLDEPLTESADEGSQLSAVSDQQDAATVTDNAAATPAVGDDAAPVEKPTEITEPSDPSASPAERAKAGSEASGTPSSDAGSPVATGDQEWTVYETGPGGTKRRRLIIEGDTRRWEYDPPQEKPTEEETPATNA